jgi:hypothetical protein
VKERQRFNGLACQPPDSWLNGLVDEWDGSGHFGFSNGKLPPVAGGKYFSPSPLGVCLLVDCQPPLSTSNC